MINARKLWRMTNGQVSDAALVACRLPEEDGKIALFLVDRAGYEYQARPIPMLGGIVRGGGRVARAGPLDSVLSAAAGPASDRVVSPGLAGRLCGDAADGVAGDARPGGICASGSPAAVRRPIAARLWLLCAASLISLAGVELAAASGWPGCIVCRSCRRGWPGRRRARRRSWSSANRAHGGIPINPGSPWARSSPGNWSGRCPGGGSAWTFAPGSVRTWRRCTRTWRS